MNKTELLNLGYTDFTKKLIDDEELPFFDPLDERDIILYVQNEKQQGRLEIFKKVVAEKFYKIIMKVLHKKFFEDIETTYVDDRYSELDQVLYIAGYDIFLQSKDYILNFYSEYKTPYFDDAINRYCFLVDTIQAATKQAAEPQQTPGEQAAEPQPSATNQVAEAKHYNYTITTKQQQYMFNELIKNGYIAPDTDFNSFCFAISGTPIKTKFVPINWLPMLKDLYCFISEFFAAEKANKQKAVYCFVRQKEPIKIKSLTNLNFSNGEPPSADYFKELKKQISEV